MNPAARRHHRSQPQICRIYARIVDERSGRTVEELIAVVEGNYAPDVALSLWIAEEDPPAGTYTAESAGRSFTLTYPPRAA